MLLSLETLKKRRDIARILFVIDIISGRVSSPPFLAEIGLRVPSYATRCHDFFILTTIVLIMVHLSLLTLPYTTSMRSLTFLILIFCEASLLLELNLICGPTELLQDVGRCWSMDSDSECYGLRIICRFTSLRILPDFDGT
jgi:hypothetical protein